MSTTEQTRTLLWWGHSDINYSRNRICRQAMQAMGYRIVDFRPWFRWGVQWQASMHHLGKPDLVWVPCFRQRDILAARSWASKHQVPLLVDPLISAWDKQVFERAKFAPDSHQARQLKIWESGLLQSADIVLADTDLHARLFADELGVARERLFTVHVGAEEPLFQPRPRNHSASSLEILFYGSFIGLHGVETIIEAARLAKGQSNIIWTLLGDGPQKPVCIERATGFENIRFESAIPYHELPQRIANADILLGVFGGSAKAGNVIPNKVFQALACRKPVITRHSSAYPPKESPEANAGLALIAPENPTALLNAVMSWAAIPTGLPSRGEASRNYYDANFSKKHIQLQLQTAIQSLHIHSAT